jgi:hypothetical protein
MTSTNTLWVKNGPDAHFHEEAEGYVIINDRGVTSLFGAWGEPDATSQRLLSTEDPLTTLTGMIRESSTAGWAEHDAGSYSPRFYRGSWINGFEKAAMAPMSPKALHERNTAAEQEDIHSGDLAEIARVVSPDATTKSAYGSRIRNLLMAACTECESQMKGILRANNIPSMGKHYCTNDYVKLHAHMRLADHSLRLPRYQNYGEIYPFNGWDANNPTKSLPWYDAYNATKHDREADFNRATLEHAISAVGALKILLMAQYGPNIYGLFRESFFMPEHEPAWHPRDCTFAPPPGKPWIPVPYAF